MQLFLYYLSALIPLALLDSVWLLLVARGFYADKLGFLITKSVNVVPVLVFYPLYTLAVIVFAVMPAVNAGSWTEALWRGALLGLAAYGAYDLTNQATIAQWPTVVTIVDITWGVILTALTSVIAYFIIIAFR